jgi:hypothetical protein
MDSGQFLLVNLFACIIGVCLYVLVLQALNRTASTLVEIRDIIKSQSEPLHLALKYLDNIDESLRQGQIRSVKAEQEHSLYAGAQSLAANPMPPADG